MTLDTIPLERAYLCADCERIGSCASYCPCCGSQHGIMSLSSVLNRETKRVLTEIKFDDFGLTVR